MENENNSQDNIDNDNFLSDILIEIPKNEDEEKQEKVKEKLKEEKINTTTIKNEEYYANRKLEMRKKTREKEKKNKKNLSDEKYQMLQKMSEAEKDIYYDAKRKAEKDQEENLKKGLLSEYKIFFDLEFVDIMKEREMKSLVLQLAYSYSLNKILKFPFNFSLFSYKNSVKFESEKMGAKFWHVNFFEENFYEIEEISKKNLIYLSPDSPNVLKEVSKENIYLIGGFVDKPVSKNRTLYKANSLGIQTAKLPIEEYVDDIRSCVLNVNTVVEILGNFIENNDWELSIKKAIPKRMNFK